MRSVERTTRTTWERIVVQYPLDDSFPEFGLGLVPPDSGIGAAILYFESDGEKVRRTGELLSVTHAGVLLKLRDPVAQHTKMVLQLTLAEGEAVLVGRVSRCTPIVGAFRVGVELLFTDRGIQATDRGQV